MAKKKQGGPGPGLSMTVFEFCFKYNPTGNDNDDKYVIYLYRPTTPDSRTLDHRCRGGGT